MKLIEIVCAALILVALYLFFNHVTGSGVLLIVCMSGLANMYFLAGVALFNGVGIKQLSKGGAFKDVPIASIMVAVVTGVALSIALVGMLFKLMHWPSANEMLMVGLGALLVVAGVAGFLASQQSDGKYRGMVIRAVVVMLLGTFFWITSTETLLHWRFAKYPDYVEARIAAEADPENEMLQEYMEAEEKKMKAAEAAEATD